MGLERREGDWKGGDRSLGLAESRVSIYVEDSMWVR